MSNETNQDRQPPTEDQPPQKQYATGPTGQPGEHRTDERRPKVPDHVETEGSDDEGGRTSGGGAASDRLPTNQGTNDHNSPQRGQSGQEGGSRSEQSGSSGSSGGSPTGSGSGNRPGGGKP
jgi:hypothetical protein